MGDISAAHAVSEIHSDLKAADCFEEAGRTHIKLVIVMKPAISLNRTMSFRSICKTNHCGLVPKRFNNLRAILL